jgi:hypothetical protein
LKNIANLRFKWLAVTLIFWQKFPHTIDAKVCISFIELVLETAIDTIIKWYALRRKWQGARGGSGR